MAHTIRERAKLLNRVKRIRGQLNGVEKLLEAEGDCGAVLQTLAATRGALNGLAPGLGRSLGGVGLARGNDLGHCPP